MVGDPLPSLEAVQSIGSGYLLFAGTVYAYLPLFPLAWLSINKKTIATNAPAAATAVVTTTAIASSTTV